MIKLGNAQHKALIFNIERASSEDGPGIRTVVFLKGCHLRCKWCANPESQSFKKEVLVNGNICVNCGKCAKICPNGCIKKLRDKLYITDSSKCDACNACIDGCYADARSVAGKEYTADELVSELLKDREYFISSGGGVTFSGGEPLFYAGFIKECAKQLHKHNINILVETCGYIPTENIKEIYRDVDFIFYDIKHMDEKKHIEYTTVSNKLILQNLIWLNDNFKGRLSVRCPVISGMNDEKENMDMLVSFVSSLKNVYELWFLPYHRLGLPKYEGLGRTYEMGNMESLKFKDIEYLKDYQKMFDVKIKI